MRKKVKVLIVACLLALNINMTAFVNANGAWTDGNEVVQTESSFNLDSASSPTGYTDGVSNDAIEMLTASREELAAKYGTETVDSGRGYGIFKYANSPFDITIDIGFSPDDNANVFKSGKEVLQSGGGVRVFGPAYVMIDGVSKDNYSFEIIKNVLKSHKFKHFKDDTVFFHDDYFIEYFDSGEIALRFTDSYINNYISQY